MIKKELFGKLPCGCEVYAYTLSNDSITSVCILNYGGILKNIWVKDKNGVPADVICGFDSIDGYLTSGGYQGALIGRIGNRIAKGKFTLEGKEYQLYCNDGQNSLHGGKDGFNAKIWDVEECDCNESPSLVLTYVSADGEENYPGTLSVKVTYTLTKCGALKIHYEATTDKTTIVNMTNHAYFNLSGDPAKHSIEEDVLWINASHFTPVDSTFMTTGEIRAVADSPMDFREAKAIGRDINLPGCEQLKNGHGYDHNWVLDTERDIAKPAATLWCPESGIMLTVYTDEPGIQVYTGNFLDGSVVGKKGIAYPFRSAVCLETQHYPDSPNKTQWPSVVLRPGETYSSHCIYAFGVKE